MKAISRTLHVLFHLLKHDSRHQLLSSLSKFVEFCYFYGCNNNMFSIQLILRKELKSFYLSESLIDNCFSYFFRSCSKHINFLHNSHHATRIDQNKMIIFSTLFSILVRGFYLDANTSNTRAYRYAEFLSRDTYPSILPGKY